jgi:hypothetical protein
MIAIWSSIWDRLLRLASETPRAIDDPAHAIRERDHQRTDARQQDDGSDRSLNDRKRRAGHGVHGPENVIAAFQRNSGKIADCGIRIVR